MSEALIKFLASNWTTFLILGLVIYQRFFKEQEEEDGVEESTESDKEEEKSRLPSPEQALQLIKDRRTILPKDYNGSPVTQEDMDKIFEAANWAPTHLKNQPWRYIVLEGHDAIKNYLEFVQSWYTERSDQLSEQTLESYRLKFTGAMADWPNKSSHVALIIMKRNTPGGNFLPEWEEMCAVAASVQNIHLMATALGVSGFWSSHTWCKDCRDSEEMRKHLGMEEGDRLLGAFTFGHVDEDKLKSIRSSRVPVSERMRIVKDKI